MRISWLFNVDNTYYWSFENITHSTIPYLGLVDPSSFSGITESMTSTSTGLISSSDLTISVVASPPNLRGKLCYIKLLVDGVERKAWTYRVKRSEISYGKTSLWMESIIGSIVEGYHPTTKKPEEVWKTMKGVPNSSYVIPQVFGKAFIPLRSVYEESLDDRYYVLGDSAFTYTIDMVKSPKEWANQSTWDNTFSYPQSTLTDYKVFQALIWTYAGAEVYNGIWRSGDYFYDMPARITSTEISATQDVSPADVIYHVLKNFLTSVGLPESLLDATSFADAKTTYSSWGLEWNGGFYDQIPRDKRLSNLLLQANSVLKVTDKIYLYPISSTIAATFGKSEIKRSSYSYNPAWPEDVDGGYIEYIPDFDTPQDRPVEALVWSNSTQTSADDVIKPTTDRFNALYIHDSVLAQKMGILYYNKLYNKKGNINFSILPSITYLGIYPGQYVSVVDTIYGGTHEIQVSSITYNKDLSISFTGEEYVNGILGIEDLTPAAIVIPVDTEDYSYQSSDSTNIPSYPYLSNIRVENSIGDGLTFVGRDCYITWDNPLGSSLETGQYKVEILKSTDDSILQTVYTTESRFDLTYEKNVALTGGPYRRFGIKVTLLVQEKTSTPLVIYPYNPPPGLVSGISFLEDFRATTIMWNASTDRDVSGYRVYIGDNPQFIIGSSPDFEIFSNSPSVLVSNKPAGIYYVKIVAYDAFDSSDLNIPTYGLAFTITETVAQLLEELTDQITSSELHTTLTSRIDLIDTPTTGLVAKLAAVESDIDTITTTLSELQNIPAYDNATTYALDDVVSYDGGLYRALGATTGNLPTNATYWEKVGDYASLGEAVAAHAVQLSDHETRITDNEGDITAEATARETLATQMRGAYTGTDIAAVTTGLMKSEKDARSTADSTEVTARQALATQMRGAYTGTNIASVTTGLLFSEKTARSTADSTEVTARQALSTKLTGVTDPASKTLETLTSGLIYDEKAARSDADGTIAYNLSTLSAQVNHATTGLPKAHALIVDEQTARVAGDDALSQSISTLSATVENKADNTYVTAQISTEAQARADGDGANATQITNLKASAVGGANLLPNADFAFDINGYTVGWKSVPGDPVVYVARDLAGAEWVPPGMHNIGIGMSGTPTGVQDYGYSTYIPVEPGGRYCFSAWAAALSCGFQIILLILDETKGVQLAAPAANLLAGTTGGTSLAGWQRLSVFATIPSNGRYASLLFRQVANGESNPYSWVLRPMFERATAEQTNPSPWAPSASALYAVKTDVNGKVAGFGLANDGTASLFEIVADRFAICNTSGAGAKVPFVVDATYGVVMDTALIANLTADKINAGALRGINVNSSSHTCRGTYLISATGSGYSTIYVHSTADFNTSGSGYILDGLNDKDEFTWTGKTTNALTGCSGVLAHNANATVIPKAPNIVLDKLSQELRVYGYNTTANTYDTCDQLVTLGIKDFGDGGAGTDAAIARFGNETFSRGLAAYFENNNPTIETVRIQNFQSSYNTNFSSLYVYGCNTATQIGGDGIHGVGKRAIVAYGYDYDFYASGPGTNGPFTGSHDALLPNTSLAVIGDIVYDTLVVYRRNISNTLTSVDISEAPKVKSVVGVLNNILSFYITAPLQYNSLSEFLYATTVANLPASMYEDIYTNVSIDTWEDYAAAFIHYVNNYSYIIVNSIGEGQINVVAEGGNIEAGDYICSSSTPGKGMKQEDDLLHNYTVAKAREDVVWTEEEIASNAVKMVACTYHCG